MCFDSCQVTVKLLLNVIACSVGPKKLFDAAKTTESRDFGNVDLNVIFNLFSSQKRLKRWHFFDSLTMCHVTAVIIVKTHSPVTWNYKRPNRCVSWRNHTICRVYSSIEPNLTLLTLRNTLMLFLRYVYTDPNKENYPDL